MKVTHLLNSKEVTTVELQAIGAPSWITNGLLASKLAGVKINYLHAVSLEDFVQRLVFASRIGKAVVDFKDIHDFDANIKDLVTWFKKGYAMQVMVSAMQADEFKEWMVWKMVDETARAVAVEHAAATADVRDILNVPTTLKQEGLINV